MPEPKAAPFPRLMTPPRWPAPTRVYIPDYMVAHNVACLVERLDRLIALIEREQENR